MMRGFQMNSWHIFINDIKNICSNWVAGIIVIGLIILPSLYAWFNIKASWDPYSQTSQIPVGIVNEDEGATVHDKDIDVGKELVKTLKSNKSMGWRFTNRKEAMEKLKYGDFYAVIIIPKNFSERLSTVISDHPTKAEIDYFVNEKINAIAPKITEKGASVIVEKISGKFISIVNGMIFTIFNDLGIELYKDLPDMIKFENYIFTLEKNLPNIHRMLSDSRNDLDKISGLINKAQHLTPEVDKFTNIGLKKINQTEQAIHEANTRLNAIKPRIEEDLNKIQQLQSNINHLIQSLNEADLQVSDRNTLKQYIVEQTATLKSNVQSVQNMLENINHIDSNTNQGEVPPEKNTTDEKRIQDAITSLKKINKMVDDIQNQTGKVDSNKENEAIKKIIPDIKAKSQTVSDQVDAFMNNYKKAIEPFVNQKIEAVQDGLKKAKTILEDVHNTIPEVETILNRTNTNVNKGKDMLDFVSGEFPYINDKVLTLANKIRKIRGESDINEIIDLLRNDPTSEESFFAEPVVLKENSIFSVQNYGTGMTPFYTVLAIWVGGLLLISLLSTEPDNPEEFSSRDIYIGRLLTFATVGFFQSFIVTVGDLFLLKVKVAEPGWFVLFGIFCSFIFITIVYTLVSVFGDVGKALAIVLLVLQIAGSGGTYPVVLLPKFFQNINPILPFTYAIDMMREATGGILWKKVRFDTIYLCVFGLVAFIVGGYMKEYINKKTENLKKKSKESGIFH